MTALKKPKEKLIKRIWKHRWTYFFILPGLVYFAIFHYKPMFGLILAFKKYNARLGILGSQWVGLDNFKRIFITPLALKSIQTTFEISFGRLLFEFIFPILLALMLNEMPGRKAKRVYQTIITFPHFLSWIIVAQIIHDFFNNNGVINSLLLSAGSKPIRFLSSPGIFRVLLYSTSIWKGAGWSAIIYIAAISGISLDLYEAARIDGANRMQCVWHITLPGIRATIILLLIMQVGHVMSAGFDQIFNLRNSAVKNSVDIIDTYVYDITFSSSPNYGFSTAVGLFKSLINCTMLITANTISRKVSGSGLFN